MSKRKQAKRFTLSDAQTLQRSLTFGCAGQHELAIANAESILRRNPYNALAYSIRATSNFQLGLFEASLHDFEAALFLDPASAQAYCGRGALKGKQNQLYEAITDFDQAIKLDHTFADAYANRGSAYFKLGLHAFALFDFTRALELKSAARIFVGRARVYVEQKQFEAARDDCMSSIEVQKNYAPAYFLLCELCIRFKNYEQAIEHMTQLIELEPTLGAAFYKRAIGYNECGNENLAMQDLVEAARLDETFRAGSSIRAKGVGTTTPSNKRNPRSTTSCNARIAG